METEADVQAVELVGQVWQMVELSRKEPVAQAVQVVARPSVEEQTVQKAITEEQVVQVVPSKYCSTAVLQTQLGAT